MHLPGPLRAAVGLAATAATEAKHLPDRAIELPMLVVSSALQASLRAQQRYARLTARGDEVLNRRTPTPEPPPWATFDEPVERVPAVDEPPLISAVPSVPSAPPVPSVPSATPAVVQAVARKQAARKAVAKKAVAKKAVATTAAKKVTGKISPAGDPAVARAKTVAKPRHTTPSAFDNVTEDVTEDVTNDVTPSVAPDVTED